MLLNDSVGASISARERRRAIGAGHTLAQFLDHFLLSSKGSSQLGNLLIKRSRKTRLLFNRPDQPLLFLILHTLAAWTMSHTIRRSSDRFWRISSYNWSTLDRAI
mmetsp:Transcript_12501/g.29266  ORF Transcript_12501/g.29266 Transcript_12501/m.29266 type:complete len:105 (-) Transcript_12501:254-568(-)